jgi:hypothetical protein
MSSYTSRMIKKGSKMGTTNPNAPKANSARARGSRRGTNKNPPKRSGTQEV